MNPSDLVIKLGEQLSREKNAASDLWTWLPSYDINSTMPSVEEILQEAADYIHILKSRG